MSLLTTSWEGHERRTIRVSTAQSVMFVHPDGADHKLSPIEGVIGGNVHQIRVKLQEPVYVVENNGHQELHYKTGDMILGKLYPVVWHGKRYVLRKTDTEVEILRHKDD